MTESKQAKAFRESLGLTLKEMGDVTGYSGQTVHLFERGTNCHGKPHDAHAWRRYKMACLAVAILNYYKVSTVDAWNWEKHKGVAK